MKTIHMYKKEVPTLRYARIVNVVDGRSCLDFESPNQFNLEVIFDKQGSSYGYGFTQQDTQKHVGEALVELGLRIIRESHHD